MKTLLLSLLLISTVNICCAQLTINNTLYTPSQLVNGVLVPVASGTTVSNIIFSGVYNNSGRYQVGYFSTAGSTQTQMGFSSGIVLSTGNTSDIPLTLGVNPGSVAQMSTAYTSCTTGEIRKTGTCPTVNNDLNILSGGLNYFNAAILEFDFIPSSTIAQFRYIFGSEEYADNSGFINYQCSSYNDRFGFLISGPGISGGQGYTNDARNIARLANGSQVSINSVNNGVVGSSGGAPSASNCTSANPSWVQNVSTAEYLGTIDGTQLNGNTRILSAIQTGLTPGQTYHIRLIVEDVNDAAYDAVVYLEAGSFTTTACTNPPAPTIDGVIQPTCGQSLGDVALSGLPSSGTWTVNASPGSSAITGSGASANFSGLAAGTSYTFTVTNSLGCTSSTSTVAVVNAAPVVPNSPVIGTITQPTCSTNTGTVELNSLPSSGNWLVTASPSGLTSNGTGMTTNFTGLAAGSSYTFTVTNSDGCTSSASLSGTINTAPTTPSAPIIGNVTQPSCSDPYGSVELSGLPSSGNWNILVNPGGQTQTGSGSMITIVNLNPGTSYQFTVTNDDGCSSSPSGNAIINVYTPSAPIISSINQPSCTLSTGSVELSGLPSPGSWTINANPSGISISGSGTTSVFANLPDNANYTFTVVDNLGCLSPASNVVTINAQPPTPDPPVINNVIEATCIVTTASIELSGLPSGGNWTIQPSIGSAISGSGSLITITGLNPNDNYSFIVTNSSGCSSLASSNVTTADIPSPPMAPMVNSLTEPSCIDPYGTYEIVNPIGNEYQFSLNGVQITSGIYLLSNLNPGENYTLLVTDLNTGCVSSFTSFTINNLPVAETVDAGLDQQINFGETSVLNALGNGVFVWSTGESGSSINVSPEETTEYCVTLTDLNGCTNTDCVKVFVNIECGELFIPTAFSPNGDNVNNTFGVKINPKCVKELNLKVYDRWGEVVFKTTQVDQVWDGKYKGKELDTGVYVYVVEILLVNENDYKKFQGNLSLIK